MWSKRYILVKSNVIMSPETAGIYRLLISNRIFYVGQCRNIKRRLLEHLGKREGNRCIVRHLAKYLCYFRFAEVDSVDKLLSLEREQIRKLNPKCNIDIKTQEEKMRLPKPYLP